MAYLITVEDDVSHKALTVKLDFATGFPDATPAERPAIFAKSFQVALDAVLRAESED